MPKSMPKRNKYVTYAFCILRKIVTVGFWKSFFRKGKKAFLVFKSDGFRGVFILVRQNYRTMRKNLRIKQQERIDAQDYLIKLPPFDADYQEDQSFSDSVTDVKALAFYLPQFHTFPENDALWSRGFAQWSNPPAYDAPRFTGHYQPREPHSDIGYYDLRDFEVIKKQVKLAKMHGVYGFCFYYYWFSGKKLMEEPVEQLMNHPEVEMPFCLCWTIEDWTRADGRNKGVLIKRIFGAADSARFIDDIQVYLKDSRYIRVNGKPVLIVYHPGKIPDYSAMFRAWRQRAREIGIGDIQIWICATSNNSVKDLRIQDIVDAKVIFPPRSMRFTNHLKYGLNLHGKRARIFNYRRLVSRMENVLGQKDSGYPVPVYHACIMGWDNSAKRENGWSMYYGFSLQSFYRWTRALVRNARLTHAKEDRFIFVDAWNEWTEGTYLEPDAKYGYACINTFSKALYDLPYETEIKVLNPTAEQLAPEEFAKAGKVRIAVQVHMFFLETLDQTIEYLRNIPYPFDCYVSTDTEEKRSIIEERFIKDGTQNRLTVEVFPNWGWDVRPMLCQLRNVLEQYDYIGHFHSKKTTIENLGDNWREYCFCNLLGSKDYLKSLFSLFERDEHLGLIFPETFPPLIMQAEWGSNFEQTANLLASLDIHIALPSKPVFPAGNMFWARTKAVSTVINHVPLDSFPAEQGQTNATIAHCIERCWVYAAASQRYKYLRVFNNYPLEDALPVKKRLTLYVYYGRTQQIEKNDWHVLEALRAISQRLFVISNSPLSDADTEELGTVADDVMQRENKGFDFGAWRDAMAKIGYKELAAYDEIVLVNNSVIGPVYPLSEAFAVMEKRKCDFWGLTLFEFSQNGDFLGLPFVPEHLQSYFLVFNRNVVQSAAFMEFFRNVRDLDNVKGVIAQYETQLTKALKKAGFRYEPYIRETNYLGRMFSRDDLLYSKPWLYLLLRMPFIKKKADANMTQEDMLMLLSLLRQMGFEDPWN